MTLVLDRPVEIPVEVSPAPRLPLNPDCLECALATPDEFEQWLSQFQDNYIVGEACEMTLCPLAVWLHDVGFVDVSIGTEYAHLPSDESVHLPNWAKRFVNDIDEGENDDYARSAADARASLAYAKNINE